MRPFVLLFALTGCAPVLHLSRPTPPIASLGEVKSVSLVVDSVVPTFSSSVLTDLSVGGVKTTTPILTVMKDRFDGRLSRLGITDCGAKDCGDAAMKITITEYDVGPETGIQVGTVGSGAPTQVHCRLSARVRVVQNGKAIYDYLFHDVRVGAIEDSNGLVRESADVLAGKVQATLEPGKQKWRVRLVDSIDVGPGVQHLKARDWNAATNFFEALTTAKPELDAAWYNLGASYEAQNDFDKAVAAYQQALQRKPEERLYKGALNGAKARLSSVNAND